MTNDCFEVLENIMIMMTKTTTGRVVAIFSHAEPSSKYQYPEKGTSDWDLSCSTTVDTKILRSLLV